MVPQELLDDIRDRLPISQIVGERVALKKSGRNFKGLCPFHQEKTPSFMVSDEKQIYHCFGCGEGGNVFNFLMKLEGMTFVEAMQSLAQRAGVKLPAFSKTDAGAADSDANRRKNWGYRLNALAHQFFCETLANPQKGKTARDYLQKRGIPLDFAKQQGLGAAPEAWEDFVDFLASRKAPLTLAQELGLIKKREGKEGFFDFFRHRLMFPIFSHTGKIVGFSGRTLDTQDKTQAKYLNSSDSFLYSKSRGVFGIHWAKEAIRKKDAVILVEGNLDALSLVQFGIENVVAPLGTALTEDQVRFLMRFTRQFWIAFDGDAAGRNAAFRSLSVFLSLHLQPRVLVLPTGEDPDSFIRKNGEAGWRQLEAAAPTLFEFFVASVSKSESQDSAGKIRCWEKIAPILRQVTDPVEYGILKKVVSEKMGLEEKWLDQVSKKGLAKSGSSPHVNKGAAGGSKEEYLLIASLLFEPAFRERFKSEKELILNDSSLQTLLEKIRKDDSGKPWRLSALPQDCPPAFQAWLREMALGAEENEPGHWFKVGEDCLKKLEGRKLHNRLILLNKDIKAAEGSGNEKQLLELLSEKKRAMEALK